MSVITISRQLGSNGKVIGELIAEKLGYRFFDKKSVAEIGKANGLNASLFEGIDEKPTNSFLYALVMGLQSGKGLYYQYNDVLNGDNFFRIQADIIKEIAEGGNCVIMGRCADYILRMRPDLVKFFIYADSSARVQNIMERNGVSEKEACSAISKADKRRANYYNFYTNHSWGNVENYDLALNVTNLSKEDAAELLIDFIKLKNK